MEPVKGGTLAKVPEEAEKLLRTQNPAMSVPSWAIHFSSSLPNVMLVLSGMSTFEQMEDNISYMADFKPLTEEYVDQVCVLEEEAFYPDVVKKRVETIIYEQMRKYVYLFEKF